MKIVTGNLIDLALEGKFDVIVHGCNCQHTMGGGIAREIRKRIPSAYAADLKTPMGTREKLGTCSFAYAPRSHGVAPSLGGFVVANAYTQFGFGAGLQVDYDAIRRAFALIREMFALHRIGYPKIGAGLGGGDWGVIAAIIETELEGCDHTLVEFDGS